MLWDLQEARHLYSLDAKDPVHSLVFSPSRYWLCAATSSSIKVFDLETKSIVEELVVEDLKLGKNASQVEPVSLAWSADGQTLFSGWTDSLIRVWQVMSS